MIEFLLGITVSLIKTGKTSSQNIATNYFSDIEVGIGAKLSSAVILILLSIILSVEIPYEIENLTIIILIGQSLIYLFLAYITPMAIRKADISLVTPIFALTPILTTIFAFIVIDESLSLLSISGVVIVVIGAYLLKVEDIHDGLTEPLKALKDEKGVQLGFVIAVLGAIIPVFDKIGLQRTSVEEWVFLIHLTMFVMLSGFILYKYYSTGNNPVKITDKYYIVILVGITNVGLWIVQIYAYSITDVAYVITLKRLSIVFNAIVGYYYFNEKNALKRIPAIFLILIGTIILTLGM